MKILLKLLAVTFILLACKPEEPKVKFQYETNPNYSWGYAEYYGPYYLEYKNNNNVLSLSLFSDSLNVVDGNLNGIGQYLYIEDIFVPKESILLPEGKYVSSSTGEPFTFYPGEQFPVDEFKIDVGAFLYYIEKNKNYTAMKQISRGSFTVKIIDSKHIINCDFVLSDSTKVSGSFKDTLPHFDSSSQLVGVPRHKIKFNF